jgi:hypothetical protein
MPTYLSIDVGLINLGMSMVSTNEDHSVMSIMDIELVDLSALDKSLTPYNTNRTADRVGRLMVCYKHLFDRADHVLLEAQPLHGLQAVEQLIFVNQRDKIQMMYPATMHIYYGLTRTCDLKRDGEMSDVLFEGDKESSTLIQIAYNARKEETVEIAQHYLSLHAPLALREKFQSMKRKHDISDSLCYAFMVIEKMRDVLSPKHPSTMDLLVEANKTHAQDVIMKKRKRTTSERRPVELIPLMTRINEDWAWVAGRDAGIAELHFYDHALERERIRFHSKEQFFDFHSANLFWDVNGKEWEVAREWFKWSERRMYSDAMFLPGKQSPSLLNLDSNHAISEGDRPELSRVRNTNNEIIEKFIACTYDKTKDHTQRVKQSDIYNVFRDWLLQETRQQDKPTRKDLFAILEQWFPFVRPKNRLFFTNIVSKSLPTVPLALRDTMVFKSLPTVPLALRDTMVFKSLPTVPLALRDTMVSNQTL